ncbi:unnamed protein product, partial [Closterium sp. NIES-53]
MYVQHLVLYQGPVVRGSRPLGATDGGHGGMGGGGTAGGAFGREGMGGIMASHGGGGEAALEKQVEELRRRTVALILTMMLSLLPCIEAAALGASESALPGTAPAEALLRLVTQVFPAVSFTIVPPSLHYLHLFRSDWLTPQGAQFLPVPLLFFRVQRFRPAHYHVFTSPCSLQT